MATLIQLCDRNQLFLVDPQLPPSAMEERFIYLLPRAKEWFEKELPAAGSTWNIEESPIEQVDALMEVFCSGDPLVIGHAFKYLICRDADGVWELKTADVRIFGWFAAKDHFVASGCGLAQYIKESGMYYGYCTEAKRNRDALDLDELKFIAGDNPDGVVSNWHKP